MGASVRQAAGAITHQMIQQAYLLAADDLFWLSGWISLAMIALIWFARRPAGSAGRIAADKRMARSAMLLSISGRQSPKKRVNPQRTKWRLSSGADIQCRPANNRDWAEADKSLFTTER